MELVKRTEPAPAAASSRILFIEGLRGISVLLVILYHLDPSWCGWGGYAGVNTFFVLSGFIITHLLVQEWRRTGRIEVARFYLRRTLRLMPALVAMVLVTILAARLLLGKGPTRLALIEGMQAIGAIYNYAWIWDWPEIRWAFMHCWSLSIEWQFYLAWPLLLGLLLRACTGLRQAAGVVFALAFILWMIGCLLAWTGRWDGMDLLLRSEFRTVAMLIGGGIALMLPQLQEGRWPVWTAWLAAAAAVALVAFASRSFPPDTATLQSAVTFPFFTLAPAALVLVGMRTDGGGPIRLLSGRVLVFCGAISYGLYLWHWPVFAFVDRLAPGRHLELWLGLPLAFSFAIASYRLLEIPLMSIRRRLGAVPRLEGRP